VNVIPEPSTLPLLFVGSLVLRWVRIKNSRKGKKDDFTPYLLDNAPETLGWVEIKNDHKQRDLPRNRCEAAIRKVTSLQA
jgi:hypothetical protein